MLWGPFRVGATAAKCNETVAQCDADGLSEHRTKQSRQMAFTPRHENRHYTS
jgi:hypothetical protein